MQTDRVAVWKTLGGALGAPFKLSLASWKALSAPLLAFAGVIVMGFALSHGHARGPDSALVLVLVVVASAWLALVYQRQLLLGAGRPGLSRHGWRRFGLYLPAAATVGALLWLLAVVLGNMALPTVAWFLMALDDPSRWTAASSVVLGVFAYAVAAWAVARLALILPALAVDHAAGPARLWGVSQHNGGRLLVLLVMVPGLAHGLLDVTLPVGDSALPVMGGAAVDGYLLLVHLGILAFVYRTLSTQAFVSPDAAAKPAQVRPRTLHRSAPPPTD